MVQILTWIILILIISIIVDRMLRSKYNIKRKKFEYYHSFQKWVEWALLFIFIFSVFNVENGVYPVTIYFSVLFSFRGYMQWKHDREGKEYIITWTIIPLYLIFLIGYILLHN